MDRKDWTKHTFRNYKLACEYANKLNAIAVGQGGSPKYVYIANPQYCTIVRYYLLASDHWSDSGLVEAPEEHRN